MKIAIMYIATGNYIKFWDKFYESTESNFLPNLPKEYFVFTNHKSYNGSSNENVNTIKTKKQKWPYNTLLRFQYFLSIKEKINDFDYVYFFNSNAIIRTKISEENILPDKYNVKTKLVFTIHPGYFNKPVNEFPIENNVRSNAYISLNHFKKYNYICGGLFGGTGKAFIEMSEKINNAIQKDSINKVMAKWHDESHINKYMTTLKVDDYKYLDSSYCYPENWNIPFEIKIEILDKKNYIKLKKTNIIIFIKKLIKKLF